MDERELRAAGIDYDGALARFVGSRGIYEKYLLKFREDTHVKDARAAFAQQDYQEMLEQVHALKGLSGTLGMTLLYQISTEIVRELREQQYDCMEQKMEELEAERERLLKVLVE